MVTIELNPKEMTEKDWDKFQTAMDEMNNAMMQEISDLAKELNVSEGCATNIWYLRTRSRWTQESEDYLIELERQGKPVPNMNEYG